jgi:hypothetical protein
MMTLANMRQQNVRSLSITCGALGCHHQAVLDPLSGRYPLLP